MLLRSLTVHNLRSYELYSIKLHPETTLIIGKNGTGKTTLLEAIYVLHRGTTFRGRDRDMIPHEKTRSEIKADFTNDESRRAQLLVSSDNKASKQFTISDKKSARLAAKDRLPVVLFEPDELRLLTSSPSRRRDFIDGIITRLSPTYSTVVNRFARTLLQRNELLKQLDTMNSNVWESHLFAWDVKLAELSATIIKTRVNFLTHSNQRLSDIYSSLASSDHTLFAQYESEFTTAADDGLQQSILAALEARRKSDGLRGFTSVGPHRDDFSLQLDSHPAAETASRGEMRTIMLAFKLLEVELQEHHSGKKPLILLDDVFSELDIEREQKLIEQLQNYQTIITATDTRGNIKNTTIISL